MINDLNTLNRIDLAISLVRSFLKSNFPSYDAVELAMDQFGLSDEDNSSYIFDLICRMVFN